MRKHHKEDCSGWWISFKKISVRGSIPKENSVRWSIPRWKDTFSIDDKGGDIYQMQDRNSWRERIEVCRQGRSPSRVQSRGEPQRVISFSIDVKVGEIETLMRSISMNAIMT
jgi:hypothetical protein